VSRNKFSITIEIDYGENIIKIKTSSGYKTEVSGVALFSGSAEKQNVFNSLHGSSSDCAWAFGEAFKTSRNMKDDVGAAKAMQNFFKQGAAHVCQAIDPNAFRNELQANKWLDPDQENWGSQDSEDVLIDKSLAEKDKKWN
jgi:hypothetical protein